MYICPKTLPFKIWCPKLSFPLDFNFVFCFFLSSIQKRVGFKKIYFRPFPFKNPKPLPSFIFSFSLFSLTLSLSHSPTLPIADTPPSPIFLFSSLIASSSCEALLVSPILLLNKEPTGLSSFSSHFLHSCLTSFAQSFYLDLHPHSFLTDFPKVRSNLSDTYPPLLRLYHLPNLLRCLLMLFSSRIMGRL